MLSIIRYIVFLIFCVNASTAFASEVVADIEKTPQYMMPVTGRLDLPHPASMRDFVMKNSDDFIGRLLLLGKYFDEKYPGDLIEGDFSDDVALIFPELSPQEVYDRTKLIRRMVVFYRWGVEKYTDIKASFLAPKEPPLFLEADDFDQPQNYRYIEPQEQHFVLVQDFKKALTYGSNPKDVEAREAYQQRLIDAKGSKTAFEKFKSMIGKIEFSKIPFYGVSLPSPFVGNAGIGKWQSQNGFKVRVIADTATIKDVSEIMAAVHVIIPNHRFILAGNLSDELSKPDIKLADTFNVKDYQVLYPLPIKVASEEMIAAYAGDLAFPIKITTIDPTKPVAFKADFTFQNCSPQMMCQKQTITSDIFIKNAADNAFSSMQNFVKQSFYNLPKNHSKYLSLYKTNLILNKDGSVERLLFVFDFKGKIDNFALFLESNTLVRFANPKIAINDGKIYASVATLNNNLYPSSELTLTARLNDYTSLRTQINLKQSNTVRDDKNSLPLFSSLISGLLFVIFPLGFAVFSFTVLKFGTSKSAEKFYFMLALGVFVIFNTLFLTIKYFDVSHIIFGQFYSNSAFLTFIILLMLTLTAALKYQNLQLKSLNLSIKAAVMSVIITVMFIISGVPFLPKLYHFITSTEITSALFVLNCLSLGVALPYLLIAVWIKYSAATDLNSNVKRFLYVFGMFCLLIALAWLFVTVFIQAQLWHFIKFTVILLLAWLVLKYLFSFVYALHQTDLPEYQKQITEKIICLLAVLTLCVCAYFNRAVFYNHSSQTFTYDAIHQKITDGKTVIVGITTPWCIVCKINNQIALSRQNLTRWQQVYNLEYIQLNAAQNSKWLANYMQEFETYELPMYIMYNLNLENGLLLPKFINDTDIEQTLDSFKI